MPVHENARNAPVHAPRAPGHEKVPFDPVHTGSPKKSCSGARKIAIAPVSRQNSTKTAFFAAPSKKTAFKKL